MDINIQRLGIRGKLILVAIALLLTFVGHTILTRAAVLNVGTEAELISAIENGDSVRLTTDIILTNPIDFPNGYNGSIGSADSNQKKISPGGNFTRAMFNATNIRLSVDNINFDGLDRAKIFDVASSNITIDNSILQNGNSEYTNENAEGGAIRQLGGSITITGSNILNNNAIRNAQHDPDSKSHGGAIYVLDGTLTINTSILEGNMSGQNALDRAGGFIGSNGGVVYAERSAVNFSGVTASKNSAYKVNDAGGFKGGVLYAYNNSTVNVTNSTFNVGAGFNVGGAIAIESSVTANISNSNFYIRDLGDAYGISGGAISSSNSNLTVTNGTFVNSYSDGSKKSKLTFAGGFIDIIGSGNFVLKDSNLTGPGRWWQGPSIATYGGAVTFETGSTATGLIENTNIKNVTSDEGGAISISTRKGERSAVTLEVKNSTIENTAGGVAGWKGYGGAVFVGPGNTLLVNGGEIKNTYSLIGGAIYNEGTSTITGGSSIHDNRAYTLGSGIYNDGVLTVDTATIRNNFEHPDINPSGKTPKEYSGNNIYANKDVTITPNAVFDDYDVRVLDGQSAIILTGTLNKKINVSVSEISGGRNPEPQYKHIGYVVAKGNGRYEPVKSDANFLHYVVLNGTDASEYNDNTSVGKWDYVLNPTDKTVVVGQRAKMIYHANHTDAKFADDNPTKEQIYEFYESTPTALPLSTPNQMTRDDEEPTDDGFVFADWYTYAVTDNDVFRNRNANLFDFENTKFVSSNGEITEIIDPNIINVYAGWERAYNVTYRFEKAPGVIPDLPSQISDRITNANFENNKPANTTIIPNTTNDPQIDLSSYTDDDNDGIWRFISWDENSKTIVDRDIEFVGTWSLFPREYRKTHEFIKANSSLPDLPGELTDRLRGKDESGLLNGAVVPPNTTIDLSDYPDSINDGTWTFVEWDFNTQRINRADVHFIGKWTFERNEHEVPTDPEDPTEPENPDPATPSEPERPTPPDPVEPERPVPPTDPVEPERPVPPPNIIEPESPATPSEPERPIIPEDNITIEPPSPNTDLPQVSLPNTSGGGSSSSGAVRRIIITDPVEINEPIQIIESEVVFEQVETPEKIQVINSVPKTADENNALVYILLMSMTSLLAAGFIIKKTR